jgi:monoamine oxidase
LLFFGFKHIFVSSSDVSLSQFCESEFTNPSNISIMLDLVVIGAGFSGLQAAYSAKQAGLSVAVVEARDRVGGKIWSVPLASERGCAELGGAWINDSLQPRVWKYAQHFGLKVVKQRLEGTAIMQESENERFEFPFGVAPEVSTLDFYSG